MARKGAEDSRILICYDGSHDADRAVDTAAALLGPRRAVVLTSSGRPSRKRTGKNEELLELSRQILDLTKAIHREQGDATSVR